MAGDFDITKTSRAVPESPRARAMKPSPTSRAEEREDSGSTPSPSDSDFRVPDHKASRGGRSIRDVLGNRGSRDEESTGKKSTGKKSTVPPMPRAGTMAKNIQTLYGAIGMGVSMFCPPCGGVVIERAEALGETGEELCRVSPAARRTYMMLTSGSAATQHFIQLAMVGGAIASHHVPAVRNMMTKVFGHRHESDLDEDPHGNEASPNGQTDAGVTPEPAAQSAA